LFDKGDAINIAYYSPSKTDFEKRKKSMISSRCKEVSLAGRV
jgi:hypothetical protein